MSNIAEIIIAGKKYQLSCQEGEQQRLVQLSKRLDQKYTSLLKSLGNTSNEALTFIILGLMMEDEIEDLKASASGVVVDNAVVNTESNAQVDKDKIARIQTQVSAIIEKLEGVKGK
jgi:cell division protein ZapA